MHALVFVALVTATPPAVDPDVREAVVRYDSLAYGDVLPLLERALARPELGMADRLVALAYRGRMYAILKRTADAETSFVELLHHDPTFAPGGDESPRIREAFERAKLRVIVTTAPSVPPAPQLGPLTPTVAEERSTNKTIVWVGAGVVVAAVVAVLVWQPWNGDERPAVGTLGEWQLP